MTIVPVRRSLGSPAHAGMDPWPFVANSFDRGSPAHAGMDPPRETWCRMRGWLPRTRGDGPPQGSLALIAWRDGSPAHAGMDPVLDALNWYRCKAPPHTWGWTRLLVAGNPLGGSPAHVGIDPPPRSCRRSMLGLPCMRGDGPSILWGVEAFDEAHLRRRGSSSELSDWATSRTGLADGRHQKRIIVTTPEIRAFARPVPSSRDKPRPAVRRGRPTLAAGHAACQPRH